MTEPTTEAGRRLLDGGAPMGATREWFAADILAIEAEARASLDVDVLARALRPYTRELLYAGDKGYGEWLTRTTEGIAREYRAILAEQKP